MIHLPYQNPWYWSSRRKPMNFYPDSPHFRPRTRIPPDLCWNVDWSSSWRDSLAYSCPKRSPVSLRVTSSPTVASRPSNSPAKLREYRRSVLVLSTPRICIRRLRCARLRPVPRLTGDFYKHILPRQTDKQINIRVYLKPKPRR